GYSVGKMLAMAYVRTTHAWPGSKVVVLSNGRPVMAVVSQTPFFDPSGARMRAKASDGPERVAPVAGDGPPPAPPPVVRPPVRKGKGVHSS
ncbi:MAG TPA: glycine cleavage T C-terminal barrel domain-containing protein, partial [Caldilineaceae bacterium]|nr:glycine cleavage T C-terminal barrel domain-containing protein [Caldilineaceae bacterium]